jgi:hypothetical protein
MTHAPSVPVNLFAQTEAVAVEVVWVTTYVHR